MPKTPKKGMGKRPVTVLQERGRPETQPDDFHLCPLGLQFHVSKPVEPFTIMAVDIDAPPKSGRKRKVSCTGTVVRCQPSNKPGAYRVWLQFVDIPADARERLRCTAKDGQLLCSYCENF